MAHYYNEVDPYPAQWMRNLMAAGHIPVGDVDERSIEDVSPDDLSGYTQCHFFAGIAVWPLALRLAGWPADRAIWTGSCPCQPFSQAGEGAGFADERHLWPHFHYLIEQRRPARLVGEQVASKDANPWIDLVQDDLEALGYAFGAIPFPAASVGAPNIRDRIYWMADASNAGLERGQLRRQRVDAQRSTFERDGTTGRMEHTGHHDDAGQVQATSDRQSQADRSANQSGRSSVSSGSRPGPVNGFWRDADWIACRDEGWRPVEPATFPLADGHPSRVGRLRAYGNALNAQAARVFVEIMMECMP